MTCCGFCCAGLGFESGLDLLAGAAVCGFRAILWSAMVSLVMGAAVAV